MGKAIIRLPDGNFVSSPVRTGQAASTKWTWTTTPDAGAAHVFNQKDVASMRLAALIMRLHPGSTVVHPALYHSVFARREPIPLWRRLAMAACLAGIIILLFGSLRGSGEPILKGSGQCPSGWPQSGAYCMPPKGAPQCVPKRGQCPSGWRASGGACCPP